MYPKDQEPLPQLQHFPLLPRDKPQPSPKPSENIWTARQRAREIETQTNTTIPAPIVTLIDETVQKAKIEIEKYMQQIITEMKETLQRYVLTIHYNMTNSKDKPLLQMVANSTSKKLLNNKVQFVPLDKHMDIFIKHRDDMKEMNNLRLLNERPDDTPTDIETDN